jgi:hypothetical protein
MTRRTIHHALQRLAGAESAFLASDFLAPVVRGGGGVTVQIAGVRFTMTIEPRDFGGWGVFRPVSPVEARLVQRATQAQRRQYIELFPAVRLVVCDRANDHRIHALLANVTDDRFQIDGQVSVHLVDDVDLFDTIVARFDGGRFWFDCVDARTDPAAAAYLRECWLADVPANKLGRAGLTAGQREAYRVLYDRRAAARRAAESQRGELRLKRALAHAGAAMHDFSEASDLFRVTYTVDGRRHVSVVDKKDLTVQSAGICLSGEDRKFDLASLVGVLREGPRRY